MLWSLLLRKIVKDGELSVIDADGKTHKFGKPSTRWQKVTVRLHDKSLHHNLALNPELYLGEAYMDGTLTFDEGDLYNFLSILASNVGAMPPLWIAKFAEKSSYLFRRLQHYNPIGKAQENVAHHYDLSEKLYDMFLDTDRQYSCAYFEKETDTLEDANIIKNAI